jgi:membrane fusion protein (multidrug efflux system)
MRTWFQLEQATAATRAREDPALVRDRAGAVRWGDFGARRPGGRRVGAGTKLFSMVKLDELVARVFVPAVTLPVVADEQPAMVTSEFLPDRTFSGWVKRISPVIDPKSGTFKVTGRGEGRQAERSAARAVCRRADRHRHRVRRRSDSEACGRLRRRRAVCVHGGEGSRREEETRGGFDDPNNVEALSGFEVGTPVIVLGQSGLKDGAMVRSVNAAPPRRSSTSRRPIRRRRPNTKTRRAARTARIGMRR